MLSPAIAVALLRRKQRDKNVFLTGECPDAEMPMDDTISIHAAKTQLSRLIIRVESGEVITIARGKTPVARLVPVARKAKREFGSMRGKISIGPEFFEPLPEDELERWGQ